jgi:hypothetical protein
MEEQSAMLKNISHQLENLNREIPSLQVKISNAETFISSLSEPQTSLIHKMAAKPVTIDNNPFDNIFQDNTQHISFEIQLDSVMLYELLGEYFLLQAGRKENKKNSFASTSDATQMLIEYPADVPSSSEDSLVAVENITASIDVTSQVDDLKGNGKLLIEPE